MEENKEAHYCFQDRNTTTCRKDTLSKSMYITLYILFLLISVATVFLNLLVIISISYFKHLHTQTNLLILSLATSDFLVGLIVIPALTVAILEPCWVLGEYFCALLFFATYTCTSISLGSLVLISIDRYVAVCDPLMYHSKITTTRTMWCIAIAWCCSIIYNAVLIKYFVNVQEPSRCFEECYFVQGFVWSMIFDLVITMVVPCSIIITLYLKIFMVARLQARKILSNESAQVSSGTTVHANASEKKATKILAIVIFHYLICWFPMYVIQYVYLANGESSLAFVIFLQPFNSFLNPIIYAFFYPWFKETAKRILTLKMSRS